MLLNLEYKTFEIYYFTNVVDLFMFNGKLICLQKTFYDRGLFLKSKNFVSMEKQVSFITSQCLSLNYIVVREEKLVLIKLYFIEQIKLDFLKF